MELARLETVLLARDLREHGLQEEDLGDVVQVYDPDGLEEIDEPTSQDPFAVVRSVLS